MRKGFSAAVIAAILGVALYFLFDSKKSPRTEVALSSQTSVVGQVATVSRTNQLGANPAFNLPTVAASQTASESTALSDKAGQYIPGSDSRFTVAA